MPVLPNDLEIGTLELQLQYISNNVAIGKETKTMSCNLLVYWRQSQTFLVAIILWDRVQGAKGSHDKAQILVPLLHETLFFVVQSQRLEKPSKHID